MFEASPVKPRRNARKKLKRKESRRSFLLLLGYSTVQAEYILGGGIPQTIPEPKNNSTSLSFIQFLYPPGHLLFWNLLNTIPIDRIAARSVGLGSEGFHQEYKKYLDSPEWQKIRIKKINEVGGQCESCGYTLTLQVHHKTYAHIFRELPADLIVLCRHCHQVIHGLIAPSELEVRMQNTA